MRHLPHDLSSITRMLSSYLVTNVAEEWDREVACVVVMDEPGPSATGSLPSTATAATACQGRSNQSGQSGFGRTTFQN